MALSFKPSSSVSLSATTSSASVLLPQVNDTLKHIRVANNGSVGAYVKFGVSGVTATTSEMLVLPFTVELFYVDSLPGQDNASESYIAAITASGSTTLNITAGEVL